MHDRLHAPERAALRTRAAEFSVDRAIALYEDALAWLASRARGKAEEHGQVRSSLQSG
jgi:hypothetical protein